MRTFLTKTKPQESTAAGSCSISDNNKKSSKPQPNALRQALRQLRGGARSRRRSSSISTEETTETTETTESSELLSPNVMQFLTDVCPEDILPKILAFAGPQKTAVLSKVNHVWRDVIADEWTWRILCEDLYKVCFLDIVAFSPSFQTLT